MVLCTSYSIIHTIPLIPVLASFFFFNDTATTEIYTLSLHDALPICEFLANILPGHAVALARTSHEYVWDMLRWHGRSEEHTSELQSRLHLVCRLLLEKKKQKN